MGGPAFLGPWTFAMAAMMLPSELLLLRLDHATSRSALRTVALGSGYVAVWLGIGGLVVLADRASGGRLMGEHGRVAVALVLAAAAVIVPGHDRAGRELIADELVVDDEPFVWELSGNCAYTADFDYVSA